MFVPVYTINRTEQKTHYVPCGEKYNCIGDCTILFGNPPIRNMRFTS